MKAISDKMNAHAWTIFLLVLILPFMAACQTDAGAKQIEAPVMTLHEAVFMGDAVEVQKHINAGSDLNQKDDYGSTPLHVAATFGKTEVARLLIDAGADLNVRSADGSTALHIAAFFCRPEISKMLLDKGVDISIRNNYGSTALESVIAPFSSVKPVYNQVSKDLGPFGLKLDYAYLEKTRPVIVEMISAQMK